MQSWSIGANSNRCPVERSKWNMFMLYKKVHIVDEWDHLKYAEYPDRWGDFVTNDFL